MDWEDDYLAVQREVTDALISYDHQSIVISRPPEKIRQPDGSWKPASGPPTNLPAQDLFLSGLTVDDVHEVNVNGELVRSDFILVGKLGEADFREGDTFVVDNRKYLVAEMHPHVQWELKAWVVERGK